MSDYSYSVIGWRPPSGVLSAPPTDPGYVYNPQIITDYAPPTSQPTVQLTDAPLTGTGGGPCDTCGGSDVIAPPAPTDGQASAGSYPPLSSLPQSGFFGEGFPHTDLGLMGLTDLTGAAATTTTAVTDTSTSAASTCQLCTLLRTPYWGIPLWVLLIVAVLLLKIMKG